uniref:Uncharacterized protein n=1 Tax=Arundo donax TaxID=35708 RepID=A0A0A9HGE3_ARUDO
MYILEPTLEMLQTEAALQNALIATPTQSSLTMPVINDIYTLIETKCGRENKPTSITSFPPDFILRFATATQKNNVQSHGPLEGPYFTLSLQQWTKHYQSNTVP